MTRLIARSPFSRMLVLAGMAALASCGQPSPDEGGEEQGRAIPVEPDGNIGDGASAPGEIEPGTIPIALRGDWGMNAADCEGGAAAKGLLEIDAHTLTFYESVGTLGETIAVEPGILRADFAFEGEGMEWSREMRLEAAENGAVLLRRELGEGAASSTFEYRRCR